MKHSTPNLMKFKRLQRLLRESKRGTVGLLELLWIEVQCNCPEGDIGRFTNEEISILCDWDGKPDDLVAALVETGWLDECEKHRLVVHDWREHAPNYVRGSLARHGRKFADDAVASYSSLPKEVPIVPSYSSLPKEVRTEPNLTKPNNSGSGSEDGPGDGRDVFEIDSEDPILIDAAKKIIEPLQAGRLRESVFAPLTESTLRSTQSLVEWHRRQLSAKRPVIGCTEAHLLLVLATGLHSLKMPDNDIKKSRVALFIGIVRKKTWNRVLYMLPEAKRRLDEYRDRCQRARQTKTDKEHNP